MIISIDIPKESVSLEQYKKITKAIEDVIGNNIDGDVPADIVWENYE